MLHHDTPVIKKIERKFIEDYGEILFYSKNDQKL